MPLQNRVDVFGEIHAVSSRGAYTGNRGVIHNVDKKIVRQYANKRWIYCLLKYKQFKREVMSPKRWTELFFLDDVTALSAGHRPCAFCQREKYKKFISAWKIGNNGSHMSLNEIDAHIHQERRNRVDQYSLLTDLPDGVMVNYKDVAYLKIKKNLKKWSFNGYRDVISTDNIEDVKVITPNSIVRAIRSGFRV